ncbi:fructokinase [Sediminihabitans luteus]|uniref:Fructokinase n=1 Tax=Sediminihabitans luteus TaxID=1138585 RepID=A0A2M9CYR9_9CELL|nr:carbohydrate kinase [Sediminihabitans luteus]PJJ77037.1 fructokinase [Sediminihabitans luteus]GII99679.1 fructokinase [Sediminihabitans luteus]
MSEEQTARPHVLVVGEALIDVVRSADGSVDEHPGGSPANVAITLGRLGRDVELATWLGNGPYGDVVRRWLARSHVGVTAGSDHALRTSIATARLDEQGSATYEFELDWRLPPGTAPAPGALALHTGSIAVVIEPGGSEVVAVVESARRDVTVTYDPNVRPTLMGTPASARPRIEQLVALADVVKVSDEDVAWLAPGVDPLDVARRWVQAGPSLVVVTLGGGGAAAVLPGARIVRVEAPQVDVVDTVGAGDSFMGALIDGLWTEGLLGAARRDALRHVDEATVRRVLEHCARVAAVTVSRAGANPPTRAELV